MILIVLFILFALFGDYGGYRRRYYYRPRYFGFGYRPYMYQRPMYRGGMRGFGRGSIGSRRF